MDRVGVRVRDRVRVRVRVRIRVRDRVRTRHLGDFGLALENNSRRQEEDVSPGLRLGL